MLTPPVDDLSMLLAVGTVLHRVYTFDSTPLRASLAGLGLATMLIAFGVYHCVTDEVVMHSVVFGIMIVLVGIQTRSIIKHRIEEPAMRKEVSRLVTWGSGMFQSSLSLLDYLVMVDTDILGNNGPMPN
jgi:dihydroceramidase